jgi:hypothetical protein
VNDKVAFTNLFDLFEGEYLLLLPAGGNRVNLLHNCFTATVDAGEGGGPSVFGILGGRMTSPFKRINIGQAVSNSPPRATRLDDKKEVLAPSKEDFTKCKSPDEFRDLVVGTGGGGRPAELLGDLPSACFVHHSIFEIFGKDSPVRAGDLAMKVMETLADNAGDGPDEEGGGGDTEAGVQVLLFLWSIETARMSKVYLSDPPDNDRFKAMAQKAMPMLNHEGTPTFETSQKKKLILRSPSPETPRLVSTGDPREKPGNPEKTGQSLKKPPHESPDRSPIAKFRDLGGEKGIREEKKQKTGRRDPGPCPSPSGSNRSSSNEKDGNYRRDKRRTASKSPISKASPLSRLSRSNSNARLSGGSRSRSSKTKSIRSEEENGSPERRSVGNRGSPPSSTSEPRPRLVESFLDS